MVSIHLDIIKFLLIYRYLQNTYWFKRDNSNPLPAGVFGKGLRRDEGDGELRIELSPGEGS